MDSLNGIVAPVTALLLPMVVVSACRPENTGPGYRRPESARGPVAGVATAGLPVDSEPDLLVPPVAIEGRVVDQTTGVGIGDATVIVLRPGVTPDEWAMGAVGEAVARMAGAARSDPSGAYRVEDLVRGRDYTVMMAAPGYHPAIFEGGLTLLPSDSSPTRLEPVPLQAR